MRLDKLLSNLKYGSRNEIKEYIKKGLVEVNGVIIKKADIHVDDDTVIVFDGKEVFHKSYIYLMLNKPKGYICANKDGLHKTVLELIKEPYSRYDLMIVGRLDLDTEGLLLITNDGMFCHEMTSPQRDCYKKYYVKLKNELKDYDILENGVEILDGQNNPYITKEAKIEKISDYECYISIKEGKFHQVKRMFEYINNEVIYLKRIEMGEFSLNDLKLGEYIELNIGHNKIGD